VRETTHGAEYVIQRHICKTRDGPDTEGFGRVDRRVYECLVRTETANFHEISRVKVATALQLVAN
jgi:hypothetical protein